MRFPWTGALLALALTALVLAAAAEGLARWVHAELRLPIYWGGAAGVLVVLLGVPFAVQLARLAGPERHEKDSFWKWWGAGLGARLVVLVATAVVLHAYFPQRIAAALLSLMAVYLVGMFGEAAWLYRLFIGAPVKQ